MVVPPVMSRFARKPIATLSSSRRPRRRTNPLRRAFLVALAVGVVAAGWFWLGRGSPWAEPVVPVESAPVVALADEPAGAPMVRFESSSSVEAVAPAAPAARPDPAAALEEDHRPRPPRDVFEAQIALMRDSICPGSIDGAWGGQTRNAIVAYQQKHGLRVTGQLDNTTRDHLLLVDSPLTTYTITAEDFLRLRPLPKGWLERSALDALDFSSILELVAERHWTHPNQVRRLNPGIDWERITTGTTVVVPRVYRRPPDTRPEFIVIHLAEKTLQLFDADSRLLAHFPCSIARRVEKRPVGDIEVVVTAPDPNYTFKPETFPESPEAQTIGRRLILQPGPNNPVGVAWIGLSLPGYGIHGSPEPEQIGRTESSGCFRLANWNAAHLLPLVRPGMRVRVEL